MSRCRPLCGDRSKTALHFIIHRLAGLLNTRRSVGWSVGRSIGQLVTDAAQDVTAIVAERKRGFETAESSVSRLSGHATVHREDA